MADKFEKYSIEYGYGRSRWCLDVMATSPDDALDRIKAAAAFGTVSGIVVAEIPAAVGSWLPQLVTSILNYFRKGGTK